MPRRVIRVGLATLNNVVLVLQELLALGLQKLLLKSGKVIKANGISPYL